MMKSGRTVTAVVDASVSCPTVVPDVASAVELDPVVDDSALVVPSRVVAGLVEPDVTVSVVPEVELGPSEPSESPDPSGVSVSPVSPVVSLRAANGFPSKQPPAGASAHAYRK